MHIQSKTVMTWSLQICPKEIALSKNTFQKIILKVLPQKLHLKKKFKKIVLSKKHIFKFAPSKNTFKNFF